MRGVLVVLALVVGLGGAASAQTAGSPAETRELLEAVRAGAKASRDTADHARVVPDILTQILAKLDKLENKLDKIENATKANRPRDSRAAR